MNYIKICFALLMLFSCSLLWAQEFKVPQNYKLEKKEDYKPYENEVLACIEYLESTPLDKEQETRKAANAFLLKWLIGCPYLKIEVNSYVSDYTSKNKDFLMTFLGGWARLAIKDPDNTNSFKGNLAGIKSIISVYKNNSGVKKDKKVEKLARLEKEGKLEEWLEKTLAEAQKENSGKKK